MLALDTAKKVELNFHDFLAHIAGYAGKTVQLTTINTIIGLDPAGPLFSVMNPYERLDVRDAEYVEVIHTSSRFSGLGGNLVVTS